MQKLDISPPDFEWFRYFKDIGQIVFFYKQVIKEECNLVLFSENDCLSIAAVSGNPGAQAIMDGVIGEDSCKIDWPKELGQGAEIVSLFIRAPLATAVLKNGEVIEVKEN